jgi:hypothetical protein
MLKSVLVATADDASRDGATRSAVIARNLVNFSHSDPFSLLETMKHCACGRTISPDSWECLPLVGRTDNGRGIGELLELRNCACGSTLAMPIGVHGPCTVRPRAQRALPGER